MTSEEHPQQPDDHEPSAERQAELEAAYEAQQDTDAPYTGVRIQTLGELHWVMAKRRWVGELHLPEAWNWPNLRGDTFKRPTLAALATTPSPAHPPSHKGMEPLPRSTLV